MSINEYEHFKSETKQLPGIWISSPPFQLIFNFLMSCLKKKKTALRLFILLHLSTITPTSQCFRIGKKDFFFLITKKQLGKTGPGLGGSGVGTGSPLGCGVVISNPSRLLLKIQDLYFSLAPRAWDWWKVGLNQTVGERLTYSLLLCLTKLFPWNDGE